MQARAYSTLSRALKVLSLAEPLKESPFRLPSFETVDTVYYRLPDGRIVPRRKDELVERPTPPKPKS